MKEIMLKPDYIFESSWEVCNKVGGIYTVLSTRARTLSEALGDNLVFIGPDCWKDAVCPFFEEDENLLAAWHRHATTKDGLRLRIGRWTIPGRPVAVLVDFTPYYQEKDRIYTQMWEWYGVDSLHAYGDYDEASMFSYAAAMVVESFHRFAVKKNQRMVYHANEWMTGLGLLHVQHECPQIATIFTTHATSIGRSIAGNNKPLYNYLWAYNGDQMAGELNMQSKQSIEKQTARYVDCFTTVSDITARECAELLDKPVDVVLPNGFEDDFVPKGRDFTAKREAARKRLLQVANALTGCKFAKDTLILSTSGRYEFRNKGIDVYLEAMARLNADPTFTRQAIAFVEVPGWVFAPRQDLTDRLKAGKVCDTPLDNPQITHWLHDMSGDNVLTMLNRLGLHNRPEDKVKVIFIPSYLNGDDGIVDMKYYDVVLGNDLCVYPSYYEPWGYTPLEAVAFHVPCITTDLAGFGLWANTVIGHEGEIADGVKVVHRDDYNYTDVAEAIKNTVVEYSHFSPAKVRAARKKAETLAEKALWAHFITYYNQAYDLALSKAEKRRKLTK